MDKLQTVAIVGLGAVGSFLSKCLVANEKIKNLLLIDDDLVENKNLSKSIYKKNDVGDFKVNAAKKYIQNISDVNVETFLTKYNQELIVPDNGLMIDCRDNTDKFCKSDCKVSVSGRRMILDCRRNSDSIGNNGFYSEKISKVDLQNATSKISSVICNKLFPKFLKNKIVYNVNMDNEIEDVFKIMKSSMSQKDLIYEYDINVEKRIYGFSFISNHLLDKNKTNEITIFRMDNPLIKVVIQPNQLKNTYILCKLIWPLISIDDYNFFPNIINDNFIELIPEIGAA